MSLNDYTANPRPHSAQPDVEPPALPMPWGEAQNTMYVRMVSQAWNELHHKDAGVRAAALQWLTGGAVVQLDDGRDVSLVEQWD